MGTRRKVFWRVVITVLGAVICSSLVLSQGAQASSGPQPLIGQTQRPNEKDAALLDAAYTGNIDDVRRWIVEGANVNAADENSFTALILASWNGNTEVVKILLSSGADPKAEDAHGQTALVHANQKGHTEIAALLGGESKPSQSLVSKGISTGVIYGSSAPTQGVLRTTYYDIKYATSNELKAAQNLLAYSSAAYLAARGVIGYDNRSWYGTSQYGSIIKITVSFYTNPNDSFAAWASGSSSIKFNLARYTNFDGKAMGSILAHETTHILFNTNARTAYWNSSTNLGYYKDFIHEALAYYAGNVAYAYGPRYTQSYIKQQLQASSRATYGNTTNAMSWWGAGKIYRMASSGQRSAGDSTFWTAWWTFNAAGYQLAYGKSAQTKALVNAFRNSAQLRSTDYYTARAGFESAFKYAYGKYANAGLIYDATGRNTSYLFGDYYQRYFR